MDLTIWTGMVTSEDVVLKSSELVGDLESVRVFAGGKAALVTYESHDQFTYKGTPNDDFASFSMTLENTGEDGKEEWKIVHAHRGTGQKKPKGSN